MMRHAVKDVSDYALSFSMSDEIYEHSNAVPLPTAQVP